MRNIISNILQLSHISVLKQLITYLRNFKVVFLHNDCKSCDRPASVNLALENLKWKNEEVSISFGAINQTHKSHLEIHMFKV